MGGGKNGGGMRYCIRISELWPLRSYQGLKRSHLAWTSWDDIYKEMNAFRSCILTAKAPVLLSCKALFSDSHKPNFRK